MPVGYLEVPNPSTGILKWEKVWKLALAAFDEILTDEKISYPEIGLSSGAGGPPTRNHSGDADTLREAVEQCILHRRPLAMLYDEAHHFGKVGSGAQKLLNQMDNIKSLANCSNTPHVLFGTYELLNLRGLSGQLGRRAERIHLPRYNMSEPAHRTAFLAVLKKFQEQLYTFGGIKAKLGDLSDVLYAGSWGCVGTLKDWLAKAMRDALYAAKSEDESRRKMSFTDHVYNTVLPDAELIKLGTELIAGEERVSAAANSSSILQAIQEKARGLCAQSVRDHTNRVAETGTGGDMFEGKTTHDEPGELTASLLPHPEGNTGGVAVAEGKSKSGGRGRKGGEAGTNGSTKRGDGRGEGDAAGAGTGTGKPRQRALPGRRGPARPSRWRGGAICIA
jgi:hypothetical protein